MTMMTMMMIMMMMMNYPFTLVTFRHNALSEPASKLYTPCCKLVTVVYRVKL